MKAPDYPMSVARDRFGLWLHVTGLSFREVVALFPEHFAAGALLVFEPEQLHYATSALVDHRHEQGRTKQELLGDIADLEDNAFWNRVEPLFENDSAAVWPPDCLDEMIMAQGPSGGAFGVCPVAPDVARSERTWSTGSPIVGGASVPRVFQPAGDRAPAHALPADFVYEHPSNVSARLAFFSVDDTATSVYLTDEGDLDKLIGYVVGKALDVPPGRTEGLDEVARGLRPWLEAGGVDIRAQDSDSETFCFSGGSEDERPETTPDSEAEDRLKAGLQTQEPSPTQASGKAECPPAVRVCQATVAIGLWSLRSQWPLLWRRVPVADLAWDGVRWRLFEAREVPGRRFVSPVRLIGELFAWTGRLTSYLLVFGLPLVAAALIWALSGPLPGIVALVVAILLWPRFILGANWRDSRKHRAAEDQRARKYGSSD